MKYNEANAPNITWFERLLSFFKITSDVSYHQLLAEGISSLPAQPEIIIYILFNHKSSGCKYIIRTQWHEYTLTIAFSLQIQ